MHKKTEKLIALLLQQEPGEEQISSGFRKILVEEFVRRVSKNPSYSLRAYAGFLELKVEHLSRVIRGKRGLSSTKAQGIVERLQLDADKQQEFLSTTSRD